MRQRNKLQASREGRGSMLPNKIGIGGTLEEEKFQYFSKNRNKNK
jgi:hypothetical protein